MIAKRVKRENAIIIVMAIMVLLVYSLFFLIGKREDNTAGPSNDIMLTSAPMMIEMSNGQEGFSLVNTNGKWVCKDNGNIRISDAKVAFVSVALRNLVPTRAIDSTPENLKQFGLDKAERVVRVQYEVGEKTYRVGHQNQVLNEFYMSVDGTDKIYLISSEDASFLRKELWDLIDVPNVVGTSFESITAIGVISEETYIISTSDGKYIVQTDDGAALASNKYLVGKVHSAVNSADYSCVDYDVAGKDLAKYGLDAPKIQIIFEQGPDKVSKVSYGKGEDGKYYMRENDDAIIYMVNDSYYDELVERTKLSSLKPTENQ